MKFILAEKHPDGEIKCEGERYKWLAEGGKNRKKKMIEMWSIPHNKEEYALIEEVRNGVYKLFKPKN